MGLRLLCAVLGVAMISCVAFGESRVGIRDGYLSGFDAESVWAAAKEVTTTALEVELKPDLSCPGLFEGKEHPYRIDTPENRQKVLEAAKKGGCEIVSFCTVIPFAKNKDDTASIAWVEKAAKAAGEMKVPVIMMPLGAGDLDEQAFTKRAIDFVKAVAPLAKANKVQLAVENLGPCLNKREVLKPIMEAVPNDQVGLAHDACNMYWYGHPLSTIYDLARTFAPHVRYAHAKSIKYPEDRREKQRDKGWEYGRYTETIRAGDLDFDKILGYYFDAGFKGDVVIEDDSLGRLDAAGKKKAIKDDAAVLREIMTKRSKSVKQEANGPVRVEFETSLGNFTLELYPDKAPITVANFLRYLDEGFYDGTIFHRVIPTFMIQGGGFVSMEGEKQKGLHEGIQNEAKQGLKNEEGTIAMARTGQPHSATSQFFINVKNNNNLDYPAHDGWGYCAFGRVVAGMDTVDKIKSVKTVNSPMMGGEKSQPVDPPVIRKAYRAK
ncbi:MAG: peptidylprolyl isomerase [Phycisphaerae bacterium]|nr:peptidylprolyl isomerase [Phycisphaerae bacterium]